jgi:hypothetical protein
LINTEIESPHLLKGEGFFIPATEHHGLAGGTPFTKTQEKSFRKAKAEPKF